MFVRPKKGGIMNIQSSVYTDMGLSRESVALSAVRQSIEQARQMNELVSKSAQSAPLDESRGTMLDILV